MRALFVVVQAVLAEDRFEVRLVDDEHPIETLSAAPPDPALGICICHGSHERGENHPSPLRLEDPIGLGRKLLVPVMDSAASGARRESGSSPSLGSRVPSAQSADASLARSAAAPAAVGLGMRPTSFAPMHDANRAPSQASREKLPIPTSECAREEPQGPSDRQGSTPRA